MGELYRYRAYLLRPWRTDGKEEYHMSKRRGKIARTKVAIVASETLATGCEELAGLAGSAGKDVRCFSLKPEAMQSIGLEALAGRFDKVRLSG